MPGLSQRLFAERLPASPFQAGLAAGCVPAGEPDLPRQVPVQLRAVDGFLFGARISEPVFRADARPPGLRAERTVDVAVLHVVLPERVHHEALLGAFDGGAVA